LNGNTATPTERTYTEVELLDIVKKIRALRELTRITGTITTRSQGALLRALPDEVLTRVSVMLAEGGQG